MMVGEEKRAAFLEGLSNSTTFGHCLTHHAGTVRTTEGCHWTMSCSGKEWARAILLHPEEYFEVAANAGVFYIPGEEPGEVVEYFHTPAGSDCLSKVASMMRSMLSGRKMLRGKVTFAAVGPRGSGKTTAFQAMAMSLNLIPAFEDFIIIWVDGSHPTIAEKDLAIVLGETLNNSGLEVPCSRCDSAWGAEAILDALKRSGKRMIVFFDETDGFYQQGKSDVLRATLGVIRAFSTMSSTRCSLITSGSSASVPALITGDVLAYPHLKENFALFTLAVDLNGDKVPSLYLNATLPDDVDMVQGALRNNGWEDEDIDPLAAMIMMVTGTDVSALVRGLRDLQDWELEGGPGLGGDPLNAALVLRLFNPRDKGHTGFSSDEKDIPALLGAILYEMRKKNEKLFVWTAQIGKGDSDAVIVEKMAEVPESDHSDHGAGRPGSRWAFTPLTVKEVWSIVDDVKRNSELSAFGNSPIRELQFREMLVIHQDDDEGWVYPNRLLDVVKATKDPTGRPTNVFTWCAGLVTIFASIGWFFKNSSTFRNALSALIGIMMCRCCAREVNGGGDGDGNGGGNRRRGRGRRGGRRRRRASGR